MKRCFSIKITTKGSTSTWETLREMYQTDPQRILTFGDPLVHFSQGRVFKCDSLVLPIQDPLMFPKITGYNLKDSDPVELPTVIPGQLKLVGLSLRGGLDYTQSWAKPFEQHFQNDKRVSVSDICLHDYSFLKYFRGSIINTLKKEIPEHKFQSTFVAFGQTYPISVALLLPSKFSGYVYLVDHLERVRWRGCGQSKPEEIEVLIKCADELLRVNGGDVPIVSSKNKKIKKGKEAEVTNS